MLRTEFVLIGVVLVLTGAGLTIAGYSKTRATTMDTVAGFLQEISKDRAFEDLKEDKTPGYVLIAAGATLFVAGLFVLARSRSKMDMAKNDRPAESCLDNQPRGSMSGGKNL